MASETSLSKLKSSVYSVQLQLLEGLFSEAQLETAGRLLTQNEYADVVTERSIVKLCGFPLCTRPLPEHFPRKGRHRISLREHKVYDLQEAKLFCSAECLVASRSFSASLNPERDVFADGQRMIELGESFRDLCLNESEDKKDHVRPTIDNVGKASSKKSDGNNTEMEGSFFLICEAPGQDGNSVQLDMLQGAVSESQNNQKTNSKEKENHFGSEKLVSDELKQWISRAGGDQQRPSANTIDTGVTASAEGMEFMSEIIIHEQKDVQLTKVHGGGYSNAIEGYIPRREHGRLASRQSSGGNKPTSLSRQPKKHNTFETGKEAGTSVGTPRKVQDSSIPNSELHVPASSDGSFTSTVLMECSSAGTRGIKQGNSIPYSELLLDGKSQTADVQVTCSQVAQEHLKKQNRVSWADQKEGKLVEQISYSTQSVKQEALADNKGKPMHVDSGSQGLSQQELGFRNNRLENAEALIAALAEAAEAVAQGEVDSTKAVARAGISILSNSQDELQMAPFTQRLQSKVADSQAEIDSEALLTDDLTEEFDPKDCWYSAPPEDFKPELSVFGTLWMALDGWISAASIAYIYGRDPSEQEEFTSVNGKEYMRQLIIGDGVSAEIQRTLAGCISRALTGLVETLHLSIPISTLEQAMGRLLRTMSLYKALPSFSSKQWRAIVLLLLDALSVQRLPSLRSRLLNSRLQVRKVLDSSSILEAEYDVLRDLILPLGRHPEFAAQCGA